jgi:hypothetical protein
MMRSAAWLTGCAWEQKKPPQALAVRGTARDAAMASAPRPKTLEDNGCFIDFP